MNTVTAFDRVTDLKGLCTQVRSLISKEEYKTCFQVICQAMEHHPHAPEPHNLLGILCEMQGNHPSAMRHFRAAYALDPGYSPARENLNSYGTFFASGRIAYGDEEFPKAVKCNAAGRNPA